MVFYFAETRQPLREWIYSIPDWYQFDTESNIAFQGTNVIDCIEVDVLM